MQFFTPELYLRFNSANEEDSMAADEAWEAAIERYGEHLRSIGGRMPSQVVKLTELALHDAEILLRQEQQEPLDNPYTPEWPLFVPWYGTFTFATRRDDQVVTIDYFLRDHVSEKQPTDNWPFSKSREHWLYDEVHLVGGPGTHFLHNVLLSTGVVLSIPFSTVRIKRFSVAQEEAKRRPSRSA